jgi:hypothetical protein
MHRFRSEYLLQSRAQSEYCRLVMVRYDYYYYNVRLLSNNKAELELTSS